MTKLAADKSLVRETVASYRGRALVVELHAKYVRLWPKGTTQSVNVSYDSLYENALLREAKLLQR